MFPLAFRGPTQRSCVVPPTLSQEDSLHLGEHERLAGPVDTPAALQLRDAPWREGARPPQGSFGRCFGTRMSQHVTMVELQKLMGHASITTTAPYYVAVPKDLAARVRRIQAGQ